ncbi:MAG: CHC2 zinc finger domain-containing protein, partial [Spirochaetales bacterium]|nr:CHC2 zinc finger domain-containing protein [Spirochaetales bacterium]
MAKGIPKETAERIKVASKLEDIVPNLKKNGTTGLITKCPFCHVGGKGKGLTITPSKQIWKCFSCDKGGQGAVSYIMAVEDKTYPDALRHLAEHYNISLDDPLPTVSESSRKKKPANGKKQTSFCDLQLASSGLTREDVIVQVHADDKTTIEAPAFRSGTRTQYGDIIPGEGDDMLIYYYDLEGRPVRYRKNGEKVLRDLIRVRWQNPMSHLDKGGSPIKYQSPAGSGSHLYLPEKIRLMYRNTRKVKTLYIQEGEKKAEKCCKHGINSVGVMGINNLGHQNQFPEELQLIIQRCEVEQIVFMLDSDWCDLSSNLKNADSVDTRPRSFFSAVRSYKEYMKSLRNLGINMDIWFGYVKKNEKNDKGIDDFLNASLKGKEKEMTKDLEKALNDKQGIGDYVQVHKIT